MGRQKKLTCLSAVLVFPDGPADGEHVFQRHGADDAGDLRFALAAVPAKLVRSELAGGGVVPHVVRADHEGPSVFIPHEELLRRRALVVGADATGKDLADGLEAVRGSSTATSTSGGGLRFLRGGVVKETRHGSAEHRGCARKCVCVSSEPK